MYALIALFLIAMAIVFYPNHQEVEHKPSRLEEQLNKLWDISLGAIKDKKYLRAEKALLTILRFDERNARAYNRLGILYAKQGQLDDAVECFEITQSLAPSPSSLHNVGLIYYEVGKYERAAQAFEQALQLEGNVASRHISYAKVLEKLGDTKRMIRELETAVDLERNPQSLGLLADALSRIGENDRAEKLRKLASRMRSHGNNTRIKQSKKINV